ncbi:hypothetical protein ACJX0J_026262, partial [Zea mays]
VYKNKKINYYYNNCYNYVLICLRLDVNLALNPLFQLQIYIRVPKAYKLFFLVRPCYRCLVLCSFLCFGIASTDYILTTHLSVMFYSLFRVARGVYNILRLLGDLLVTPIATFLLVILAMAPCLIKAFSNPQPKHIIRWVSYACTCGFMFGWHVHEKASLHFTIPLALIAMDSLNDARHYFLLSIVSCYSLFP